MPRGVTLLAAALLAACVPSGSGRAPDSPGGADPTDPALVAWAILPPGNGNVSGRTASAIDDQREMYDRLEDRVADGTLTDADLGQYFVDNRLGAGRIVSVDEPAPGVRVEWDEHAVPHVRGDTATDVAFGAGWAVAEGRLVIAELGRLLGRAGTLELGGPDIPTAVARIGELERIDYTDADLLAALDVAVAEAGADGPRVLAALDSFVAGINAWLDRNTFPPEAQALGLRWRHWTRADVLAVGIVVDDIFGAGGGDELGNATALAELERRLGAVAGRAAFADLRSADDPEATSHTEASFPYPQFSEAGTGAAATPDNTVDPAAVALPDRAVQVARNEAGTPTMSNYIAVAGSHTASGHPILVGGPQSSYFAPQLLFEMDLQGGGYDARGITFPGLGPWVVIGRSRTYAWTATAGGSDVTDQRFERLCEPDGSAPTAASKHYLFDGRCVAMTRPNDDPMTAWRTIHGIVVAHTTVDGAPVAVARQRMSRFQTAHAAPAFWALNQGRVTDAADFASTMSNIPMSFNWLYVNADDIAYFHSGWYPVRAAGVDPALPTWGTGEWEWQGRLDWHLQPQQINPTSGYAVSWNNKVAPRWSEPDNDWSAGTVQRVDTLADRTEALIAARSGAITPADVVTAAQDAATVDVRGAYVLPEVLALLDGPAPNAELAATRDALAAWVAGGAHRRDRADDGFYDDPAVSIMDAMFEPLARAMFTPRLGAYMGDGVRRPRTFDNPPSQTGGAFAYGWHSAVVHDLRRVAGTEAAPVDVPPSCGGGDLDTCRDLLWGVIESARRETHGLPRLAVLERIRFIPWVTNPASVRWMNRPTYQQIISFGA